jgi:Bifunctional DNA primase/polymerase, N-terminal/Primase C terminal 2 (PriCT-2)
MPRAANFAAAVREAVAVYAKTLRMGEAALVFGKHGIPIFPVDHRNKRPIPRRDPDPTGKRKDGIPGTGGFYKATCDPIIITQWWTKHPRALIAVPMGPRSGVWCVDVDTAEEHAGGGIDEWDTLLAEHEPFETREHRSATGGPHAYFEWDEKQPLGCSAGDLPKGISIKGVGGYVIVPPSLRRGRAYTVFRDIDPIPAPQWLVDAILVEGEEKAKRDRKSRQARQPFQGTPQTNLDELAEAMRFVSNDNLSWEEWTIWALAIFAASGGSQRGLEIFDEFSARSTKYDAVTTDERWYEISGSPPSATGAGKIFKAARDNGWLPKLPPAPPTYAIAADAAAAARDKMREVVRDFLRAVDNPISWKSVSNMPPPPIAHAACIDVGVGKTRITIEELAIWLKQKQRADPVIYATPRHKLNENIEELFAKQGINARIFRGREAEDPQRDLLQPDKKMCLNLAALELAKKCHAEVGPTCCKHKKERCRFFGQCGYQRQLRDRDDVQVWIVAIDTLFHTQKALGEPIAVIVDEALWQKGIRGVEANDTFDWSVAIDSISSKPPPPKTLGNINTYSKLREVDFLDLRHRLASALRAQANNGGVERKYLDAQHIDGTSCKRALGLEWERYTADVDKLGQSPGMSDTKLAALAANHGLIDDIQHARRVIQIWQAVQEFLNRADIDVSGRLTLTQDNGQRTVEWRGISPISKQFTLPTLMLDATLPPEPMLQVYHPRAQVVADIKVELPKSVHIRQLQGAPTGARKLKNGRNLIEIRRHILARYLEFGRARTLVICQQKLEEWLKQRGLPADITVEHFNNITGIDDYGDVRLMLLIGRTAPGPATTETISAALTGKCPVLTAVNGNNGFRWFDQVQRGIRLRDGSGIATKGDQHPDPDVEAVRWQIHEAELVQALGRGRGLKRTAANPLDADLLFDTAIPVTVDEVLPWRPSSALIETAIDGVMLTAPCDLVELWRYLWPNDKAAYRTIKAGVPTLPGFEPVEYQLAKQKTHKRIGYFDRGLVHDPRAWLEAKLGRLV